MKIILLICTLFLSIQGHGILSCPPARVGQNSGNGIKLYPEPPTAQQTDACDVSVQGSITATYKAGASILVSWQTTILHTSYPGVRVAVQYNSTDSFNNNVLANFGTDIGVQGLNTIEVMLPANKTSNNAIIQWIWASQEDGGFYLGCADVQIVGSGNPSPPSCTSAVGNIIGTQNLVTIIPTSVFTSVMPTVPAVPTSETPVTSNPITPVSSDTLGVSSVNNLPQNSGSMITPFVVAIILISLLV